MPNQAWPLHGRPGGYTRASQARAGSNAGRPVVADRPTVVQRAFAAYFRKEGIATARRFPSRDHSRVEVWQGREYVVLSDGLYLVAVYRVRPSDGILRRMKNPPRVIKP